MHRYLHGAGRWAAAVILLSACDRHPLQPEATRHTSGPSVSVSGTTTDLVVTDLGTLGGTSSFAWGINDSGQVVGWSYTAENAATHAVLWQNGTMTDLGALGGSWSAAVAINSAGQVVGFSYPAGTAQRAVLWQNGTVTELGTLGGTHSSAIGINDAGQVVGWSSPEGNVGYHAVLWQGGTTRDLGTLGGTSSNAYGINDAGQIVGRSQTAGDGGYSAVLWQNATMKSGSGTITDLGTLGGSWSEAHAINEAGQIVGWSTTVAGEPRAVLWHNGTMTELGTLGGTQSQALDINEAGQIVGWSTTAAGEPRAVLWHNGTITDLGTLGGTWSQGFGINDTGQVVGLSFTTAGQQHGALWAPPTTLNAPGHTPSGTYVSVQPIDEATGEPSPVSMTFSSVTTDGETTVTSATIGDGSGPSAPSGFRLGEPPTYYDIATTATFEGAIEICIDYSGASYGDEAKLKLLHEENGVWTDVTTSLNTDTNVICGSVTSLSPFLVAQQNTAPVASAGGPYQSGEGGAITFDAGHSSDPDGDNLTFEWDLDGDGTFEASGIAVTRAFADDASFTVRLRVSDGNLSSLSAATATVSNAVPVVTTVTLPESPVAIGTTVTLGAAFTDAGQLDTHTGSFDLDLGGPTATGTVAAGSMSATHVYAASGVYTITATVSDDDGGSGLRSSVLDAPAYVVVFDPSAGFVTGGGWIESPDAACQLTTACSAATGKASFGFVSRYQSGATQPSGNTEFHFKAGDFRFKSASYEWLVVAGSRAQFKGEGTINGAGAYGFLLTAIDDTTDRFRIKIWDKATGAIVYDNQAGAEDDSNAATALGGGSIVIHK